MKRIAVILAVALIVLAVLSAFPAKLQADQTSRIYLPIVANGPQASSTAWIATPTSPAAPPN